MIEPNLVCLYVSEFASRRIAVLRVGDGGALSKIQEVELGGDVMPMAITPDRRFLFASIRTEPFTIDCFAINAADGTLSAIGQIPAPYGASYMRTDRTGRFLLSAYNLNKQHSGILTVHRIGADGRLEYPPFLIRTPPKIHAVMTDPANAFAIATSCDGDMLMRYRFDATSGELSADGLAPVLTLPKSGPRHLQFHPNGGFVYVVDEYDGCVVGYRWNGRKGSLQELQTTPVAPAGHPIDKAWRSGWRGADLHFTPDGRWLYASIRNVSMITAFSVDPVSGLLRPTGHYATAAEPRSFCLDPSGRYLFAVGIEEKCLVAFAVSQEAGALTRLREYEMGDGPNWVECVRLA